MKNTVIDGKVEGIPFPQETASLQKGVIDINLLRCHSGEESKE